MYSIPVIVKLALIILVALGCLCIFKYLGGLRFAGYGQNYVVIYKTPRFKAVASVAIPQENVDGAAAYDAYMEQHVRTVLEVRETGDFRDIAIIRWASLVVAVVCIFSFAGTVTTRRRKYKRYFKSQRFYEEKLKLR